MSRPDKWFTVEPIDGETFAISEYRHWEEPHCYLLNGKNQSLLIDTGLGIADIGEQVRPLTSNPIAAVATHVHWDHIGGHRCFPDFYAHPAELDWLTGHFPLPLSAVRAMITDRCRLPEGFDADQYQIFQGTPSRLLTDGSLIDLGGRTVQVLHTPGHSPGHMCFWEEARGYLFTGDLVYQGELFANYPSTDPAAFLTSLEKVASLPVKRLFPGHHTLDIQPRLTTHMRDALRALRTEGKLHHGSGRFSYSGWSVSL